MRPKHANDLEITSHDPQNIMVRDQKISIQGPNMSVPNREIELQDCLGTLETVDILGIGRIVAGIHKNEEALGTTLEKPDPVTMKQALYSTPKRAADIIEAGVEVLTEEMITHNTGSPIHPEVGGIARIPEVPAVIREENRLHQSDLEDHAHNFGVQHIL